MFKPVSNTPIFPDLERRVLQLWRRLSVFDALRKKNADGPKWSFQDGPITANNPMGVHHAWGRTYKDIFQRYHAMSGYDLRYQNGFDCQGLWVEVEVEKALGFKTKRDILEYGIDRFVDRCKQRVLEFAARQTEQSIRLGYWMDWDDPDMLRDLAATIDQGIETTSIVAASGATLSGSTADVVGSLGNYEAKGSYFTFSHENNDTIWSFLKKCHERGFLYEGTDVMPWCCRCGTGLSQMEVAEGRKITKHTSVYVRFPLIHRPKEALLIWTTTPWTLTSNVAVAVHPDATYAKVRHGDWVLYVGKNNLEASRVQELEAEGLRERHVLPTVHSILKRSGDVEILGEVKGRDLLDLVYQGPFDHLPAQRVSGDERHSGSPAAVDAHRVIAWNEISESEGTGLVHIAPGCGAEDNALGREHGLPVISPLDEDGQFVEGFGAMSGRHVLTVVDDVVGELRDAGLLVAKEKYPHVYPHCWRCKEELVFRLVSEWFINMSWRDEIQEIVSDVRWIPAEGEARERDWLRNMGDWMISKKRFWGLALPIWVCESCRHYEVIGSRAELGKRAVRGWDAFEGNSPHRPWIDEVKIQCEQCGGLSHRIEDVGNPWLDAGIVPYSTMHHRTRPEYWEDWFPADFVVECFPGQFRNWFYALLAMSTMMTGRAPFRVLLGHALVRDERGEEMHKSSGNAIAFDDAAESLGAEVMRYVFASQNPTLNLSFPDLPKDGVLVRGGLAMEVRRKLLTWWNCYKFLVIHAQADDWNPTTNVAHEPTLSRLDRWILSRLQSLVADAHASFESFAVHRFVVSFEAFVGELSNWWLRRSRQRFYQPDGGDKQAAYETLFVVLETLNGLMAPILPFLTEEIYQNLVRSHDAEAPVSVHLLEYPQVKEEQIDAHLERQMAVLLRIKNMGLALRNKANIKVRQPLDALWISPADAYERGVLEDRQLVDQILDECNIKSLELVSDPAELARLSIRPNYRTLGPRYGQRVQEIGAHLEQIEEFGWLNGGTIDLDGELVELASDDLLAEVVGEDHMVFVVEGGTLVGLDTRVTPELYREGLARDFNRHLQAERRRLGLEVSSRIEIRYAAPEAAAEAISAHEDWLCKALLCRDLSRVATVSGQSVVLDGHTVHFEIRPIEPQEPG